jgi:hypothetical protein
MRAVRARAGFLIVVAIAGGALSGCKPFRVPAGDAGADEDTAALEAGGVGVAPVADNDADITHYPDEKPVDHLLGVTRLASSNARTQAGATAGTVVAALPPGTSVDKIAVRRGWFLVVFIDPKDPSAGRRVLGWLDQADFVAPTGKLPSIHCELPRTAVLHGGRETCETVCGACPAGQACTGSGEAVSAGVPGAAVKYCAGVAPTAPTVPSAGPTVTAVPEAGPAPHPTRPLDVKQQNGACPGGYATCGALCRLQCASDADCGLASAHCRAGFCLGPGAQPCAR